MKPSTLLALLPLLLATVTAPGQSAGPADAASRPTAKVERPNILWIIAEDLGPELGCYGTQEVWTPRLDRLAGQGVRYTRAFTVTPVCSSSRSAFMTGMYATTIGAHNHRSHRRDGYRLPEGARLLTDRLRDAGYFTANLRDLGGTGKTDWNFSHEGKAFDSARWADLKTHQPFYAQINFPETHRGRAWNTAHTRIPRTADPAKVQIPPYYPDHPVVRQDWAQYLNTVMSLDQKVGKVLDKLAEDGLDKNTVVMFFGDHGRAMVRGKQWCYDSGLHVPLLIRWPDGHDAGKVEGQLVASIDLTALTLDLAGVALDLGTGPKSSGCRIEGRVFAGPHAQAEREFIVGTRDRCDETVFRIRTLRNKRYRYIRNSMPERPFLQLNRYKESFYPTIALMRELDAADKLSGPPAVLMAKSRPSEELYDIDQDPWEIHNLATSDEHRATLLTMRKQLDDWIRTSGDLGQKPEDPEVIAFWEARMKRNYEARLARRRRRAAQEKTKAEKREQDQRSADPKRKDTPPNIVFILADDLGYKDLGCYGNELHQTPHIDRLARQGMRFTQAYANAPNCAPSRACMMSGQYGPRHGIYTVGSAARGKAKNRKLIPVQNTTVLADAILTLPELLHTRGYVSAQIGKWHLGQDPRSQGFDINIAGNQAGHPRSYFSPYKNPDLPDGKPGEYLTDRLTDEAIRFVRDHRDQPFFLWLSHYAVHTPIQARPDLVARHPDVSKRRARYAAMVESVDESTGRILDTLDQLDLTKNTLVVFFSDNGGVGTWTSMAPLRGSKGMLYEGGIREPLILRWPAVVPKATTNTTPVIGTDFLPTLCELAGVPIPATKILDGESLVSLMKGEAPNPTLQERPLFWHFPAYLEGNRKVGTWRTTPACAMRLGRYKLIEFFEGPRLELYDLETDLSETTNLAPTHPELTQRLHARMLAWRSRVNAPLPKPR